MVKNNPRRFFSKFSLSNKEINIGKVKVNDKKIGNASEIAETVDNYFSLVFAREYIDNMPSFIGY